MHKLYGKLPWADLIMPSVTIARRGFRIPRQLKMAMDVLDGLICNAPRLNKTYCVNGKPKKEGETVHLPDLADTLEAVARDGPDAFYRGPIAERTVAAVQERGGSMTMQDMAEYKVLYRPAQSIPYRNKYRVWSTSVPSSGAVVLSALRTLEHYPEKAFESNDVLATHRMIEAVKFAYGERTRYGDPAFLKNVTGYEAEAISAAAGATRYNKIDDFGTHPVSYYNPALEDSGEDHGTSHINAVDASGMAVSITTTVNLWWGSAVQTEDGILLNDDMDDFSTPGTPNQFGYEPSRANYIEPGKRPLSSMSPMMVEDLHTGELKLIAGSAGGSRIITANLQMVYSYLSSDGRVSMQEVIDRPRWHNQLLPDVTYYEYHSPNVPSLPGFNNVYVVIYANAGPSPHSLRSATTPCGSSRARRPRRPSSASAARGSPLRSCGSPRRGAAHFRGGAGGQRRCPPAGRQHARPSQCGCRAGGSSTHTAPTPGYHPRTPMPESAAQSRDRRSLPAASSHTQPTSHTPSHSHPASGCTACVPARSGRRAAADRRRTATQGSRATPRDPSRCTA